MKYFVAILFVALAAQVQAQLRCFHCQDCKDPFETENAPSQLCSDTIPPTGLDSSYLGMEVPHTEQTPINGGVGSEIELRQKRDIAEKNIVYNCYTITEATVRRGCVAYQGGTIKTCGSISHTGNWRCSLCSTELCNSASGLTVSLVTLLAASYLALKL